MLKLHTIKSFMNIKKSLILASETLQSEMRIAFVGFHSTKSLNCKNDPEAQTLVLASALRGEY